MSDLILHSYDASPFTQKVLRMLGIKNLDWQWVETPMLPPKDELVALTGGYRGTPVLQIGRHIFIDSQLIARELERRFPEPSLYPGGDRALAHMLVKWSDALFRAGLNIAIEQTSDTWPEQFLADRKQLFPDVDFDAARSTSSHDRAQFRAHALLIDEQLSDGRAYLVGASPGLVDVQAHVFVAMARGYFPDVARALLEGCTRLQAWERRMGEVGEGRRRSLTAREAHEIARRSLEPIASAVEPDSVVGVAAGATVRVSPDDTRRGVVVGELVQLDREQIVVRRRHDACGEVAVHFPRLGYRLEAA